VYGWGLVVRLDYVGVVGSVFVNGGGGYGGWRGFFWGNGLGREGYGLVILWGQGSVAFFFLYVLLAFICFFGLLCGVGGFSLAFSPWLLGGVLVLVFLFRMWTLFFFWGFGWFFFFLSPNPPPLGSGVVVERPEAN